MSVRILFGGMVSSGKSTIACSVYDYLEKLGEDISLHELDVWSDTHRCILGEKPWSERQNTKDDSDSMHRWFFERIDEFLADDADIVIGDMPGREENRSFPLVPTGIADLGVLVVRSRLEKDSDPFLRSVPGRWKRIMESLWQVPIVAEVFSVRNGDQPGLDQFGIAGLERELITHHPEIERLAEHLLEVVEASRMTPA